MSKQSPALQWQPIWVMNECIPIIDGTLEKVQSQHRNILEAQKMPYIIDGATIQRVIKAHSEQHSLLWVYREQLFRWQQENPTPKQSKEITRLEKQVDKIDQVLAGILAIADDIKDKTIESILDKSDAELVLDVLMGNLNLPK